MRITLVTVLALLCTACTAAETKPNPVTPVTPVPDVDLPDETGAQERMDSGTEEPCPEGQTLIWLAAGCDGSVQPVCGGPIFDACIDEGCGCDGEPMNLCAPDRPYRHRGPCEEEQPVAMDASADADSVPDTDGSMNSDAAEPEVALRDLELTLVMLLAADDSDPIRGSYQVDVLDSETGLLLDPPGSVETEPQTGRVSFSVPEQQVVNLHVNGKGSAPDELFDFVSLNHSPGDGVSLLRASPIGLASLAQNTAGYGPLPDRAEVYGTVYWRPAGGTRRATVSGAQVFIDGAATGIDDSISQRHTSDTGLPTTLQQLSCTKERGQFFIGNIGPGPHTARVSLDGGATFLGQPTHFVIATTRQQARGAYKSIGYVLPIDLDLAEAPTPGGSCPYVPPPEPHPEPDPDPDPYPDCARDQVELPPAYEGPRPAWTQQQFMDCQQVCGMDQSCFNEDNCPGIDQFDACANDEILRCSASVGALCRVEYENRTCCAELAGCDVDDASCAELPCASEVTAQQACIQNDAPCLQQAVGTCVGPG